MGDKQYDQAVQSLTKASEIGPPSWPFGQPGGRVHEAGKHQDRAEFDDAATKGLAAYTKAIELKPKTLPPTTTTLWRWCRPRRFPRPRPS